MSDSEKENKVNLNTPSAFLIHKGFWYGLADINGVPLTDFRYSHLSIGPEVIVADDHGNQGDRIHKFLDFNGNVLFTTKDIVHDFSEGLALTIHSQYNKYGFVNTAGEYKIPPAFEMEDVEGCFYSNNIGFCENKTHVLINKRIAVIDSKGDVLFRDFSYNEIGRFNEGIAVVETHDRKRFFISEKNEVIDILPHGYKIESLGSNSFYGFRNKVCRVKKNNQFAFIDTAGKLIFDDKHFDNVSDFHEGLAVVRENDKCGVIDINGNYIIPLIHDSIGYFSNGLAAYRKDRETGLIDNKGNIIFEAHYKQDKVFQWIGSFGIRNSTDPFHDLRYTPITRALVKKQNGKFHKPKEVYINRAAEVMFDYEW